MRKLILQMQTSIDGFVGRTDDGPSWQVWDWGPEPRWTKALLDRFNRFFVEADTILLSRKIVEGGYIDHWTEMASRFPREFAFAFAHRILAMQKVVFSESGKTVKCGGSGRHPLFPRTLEGGPMDDDTAQIAGRLIAWAHAIERRDRAGILAHHTSDLLMFDFPSSVRGIDAYDRTWDFFYDRAEGRIVFSPSNT